MTTSWWPDDDETIHEMGIIIRAAIKIADLHNLTVEEVLRHVQERWKGLLGYE